MPQRPTTHKDLHRAALGSVFSLVYLLAIPGMWAQNGPTAASAGLSTKAQQTRLVKNEPAKQAAAGPAQATAPTKAYVPAVAPSKAILQLKSSAAQVKPGPAPTAAIPVSEVRATQTKSGRLREIPLSSINGESVSTQSAAKDEAKLDGKPAAKVGSVSNTKAVSVQAKKTESTITKELSGARAKKTTASVPRLNNGLIPPPPPIVPIGMDVLGMYAQPVDYLSMKDLEARKKELMVRLNELDSTVTDGARQIRERKERAELFESLYQEGVVSRKELEIAKREAGELNRDLKFKQDELESVKFSMKAVNNRLAVLKKMEAKVNDGKQKEAKVGASAKSKVKREKN